MTHRNAQLHAAVLADPDDDAPRLVYADWLGERGEVWGELIAVQIARVRSDDPQLVQRERELLAQVPRTGVYRRGFVEVVGAVPAELDALLADACVRELVMYGGERAGATVAAALPRMRLRSLRLNTTTGDDLEALLDALGEGPDAFAYGQSWEPVPTEHVLALVGSRLRPSTLGLHGVAPGAVAHLAAWHPLRALSLEGSRLGLSVFDGHVRAPAFAQLERLDLSHTQVGEEDVFSIAASAMPLVELGLSGCILGAAAARCIASTPRFAALRKLRLAGCMIWDEGLDALLASPYLSRDLALSIDGDTLGLESQPYHDAPAWAGPIPARVAERFRVTLEGAPRV